MFSAILNHSKTYGNSNHSMIDKFSVEIIMKIILCCDQQAIESICKISKRCAQIYHENKSYLTRTYVNEQLIPFVKLYPSSIFECRSYCVEGQEKIDKTGTLRKRIKVSSFCEKKRRVFNDEYFYSINLTNLFKIDNILSIKLCREIVQEPYNFVRLVVGGIKIDEELLKKNSKDTNLFDSFLPKYNTAFHDTIIEFDFIEDEMYIEIEYGFKDSTRNEFSKSYTYHHYKEIENSECSRFSIGSQTYAICLHGDFKSIREIEIFNGKILKIDKPNLLINNFFFLDEMKIWSPCLNQHSFDKLKCCEDFLIIPFMPFDPRIRIHRRNNHKSKIYVEEQIMVKATYRNAFLSTTYFY